MYTTHDLFDLSHTLAGDFLAKFPYPWMALTEIPALIRGLFSILGPEYRQISPEVYAHSTVTIASTAQIIGPCILGPGTQVRPGAFLRGGVLAGGDCVIGNSTEGKNAILFDGVQIPHYNYVGDSILGYKAHLGAGAVTSNVKSDRKNVTVTDGTTVLQTGLRKCGAMVGDLAEVGCNSVLCPGSVLGRGCRVYPLSRVRGTVPERTIWKANGMLAAIAE